MQTKNNGGDVLARGGVRANFAATDGGVTQEKWDNIWAGYDADAQKDKPNPAQEKLGGDAPTEPSRH